MVPIVEVTRCFIPRRNFFTENGAKLNNSLCYVRVCSYVCSKIPLTSRRHNIVVCCGLSHNIHKMKKTDTVVVTSICYTEYLHY